MVWKKAHVRGSDVLGGGRRLPEQHPRPPPTHPPARVWEPLGGCMARGAPRKLVSPLMRTLHGCAGGQPRP